MSTWRKIRVIGMIIFFIEGLLAPFFVHETPFEDAPIIFNLILIFLPLMFIPLALVMVMSVQSINPFQNKQWTLPDWDSNFLNFRNPLQFLHTAAFFIAANSIGTILASFFSNSSYLVMGLGGISGSAGVLLGVKLCTKVYRKKFQDIPETVQQKMNLRAFKWSKICGTLLILCAVIVFIIAGSFLKSSINFKNRAINTTGIVKSNESKKSSEGINYYPVFSFTDNTGKEHIVRSSLGSNPPRYETQDRIQILYDPASPEEAKISSFWHLYAVPIVLGVSGMINLITGLVFLFIVPVIQKILSQ
jgi:hypothetical protein